MSTIKTVNINNIDDTVVEERLKGFLSRCGTIKKVEFNAATSPRKAVIEFTTAAACEEAIRMNGVDIGGRQLQISKATANLVNTPSAAKSGVPNDGSFMQKFLKGQLQQKKGPGLRTKKENKTPGEELLNLGLEEPPPPPPPPLPVPGGGPNALERIALNLRQKIADKERMKEMELQREREFELGGPMADARSAHRATGWDHPNGIGDPVVALSSSLTGRRSPNRLVQERERLGEKPPTLYISGLDTLLSDEEIVKFFTTECGSLLHQKIIRDVAHNKHYGFFTFDHWDSFRKCQGLDGYVGLGRFSLIVSVSMSASARHPTTQPTSAWQDRETSRRSRSRGRRSRSRSRSAPRHRSRSQERFKEWSNERERPTARLSELSRGREDMRWDKGRERAREWEKGQSWASRQGYNGKDSEKRTQRFEKDEPKYKRPRTDADGQRRYMWESE